MSGEARAGDLQSPSVGSEHSGRRLQAAGTGQSGVVLQRAAGHHEQH